MGLPICEEHMEMKPCNRCARNAQIKAEAHDFEIEYKARRAAFLEAAEMIDDGAKDCRKKVNHPFTASVLEGFSAQFRAKAEEQ